MKTISILLKNIRNLVPYFLLIAIYFFFVNLESRKDNKNNVNTENEKIMSSSKSHSDEREMRILIPVIPYDQ